MNDSSPVGYFQIILAGIRDSVNPGALTAGLVFAIFLFFSGRLSRNIFLTGLGFLFGLWTATAAIAWGYVDFFQTTRAFDVFLDTAYLILAVFGVLAGIVLLRDWAVFRRTKDPKKIFIVFPFLIGEGQAPARTQRPYPLLAGMCSWLAGGLAAFMASAWPLDRQVYLLQVEYALSKNFWTMVLPTLAYVLMFSLPLIVMWLLAAYASARKNQNDNLNFVLSKIQVVCAAVLMGYGLAILVFFQ